MVLVVEIHYLLQEILQSLRVALGLVKGIEVVIDAQHILRTVGKVALAEAFYLCGQLACFLQIALNEQIVDALKLVQIGFAVGAVIVGHALQQVGVVVQLVQPFVRRHAACPLCLVDVERNEVVGVCVLAHFALQVEQRGVDVVGRSRVCLHLVDELVQFCAQTVHVGRPEEAAHHFVAGCVVSPAVAQVAAG